MQPSDVARAARWGSIAALLACVGCVHPMPHGRIKFPEDASVRLRSTQDLLADSVFGEWHWSETLDPDEGAGQGTAYQCYWGDVQVGTWRGGLALGAVEVRRGDYPRFRGEVGADGQVSGTVFGLGKDDHGSVDDLRRELTRGDLTERDKAEIRAQLETAGDGTVVVPLFTGTLRETDPGSYEPAAGRFYDVTLEPARIRGWSEGRGGPEAWDGQVVRYEAVDEGYDPELLDARRVWSRGYRQGVPHGEWIDYTPQGQVAARVTYADGKRQGLAQRFDADGHVIAETHYEDDAPQGVGWEQVGDERWTLDHRGEGVTLASIEHADGPIERESFWLEPRKVGAKIQGWIFVEPREGQPYRIFVDLDGRRIEETKTILVAPCDTVEKLFANWGTETLKGGGRWVGRVDRLWGRSGWGRLYESPLRFEEGWIDGRGRVGYAVYARAPTPDCTEFHVLELRHEGTTVEADPGVMTVVLAADVDAKAAAEYAERKAREDREYAQRRLDDVLGHSQNYEPTPNPTDGSVRWSNRTVTTGRPLHDDRGVRAGEVLWLDGPQGRGFLRVRRNTGSGLLFAGVPGLSVRPSRDTTIRIYPELFAHRERFGSFCENCAGQGKVMTGMEAQGQTTTTTTYLDDKGGLVRRDQSTSGTTTRSNFEILCPECQGRGEALGELGSWQRR